MEYTICLTSLYTLCNVFVSHLYLPINVSCIMITKVFAILMLCILASTAFIQPAAASKELSEAELLTEGTKYFKEGNYKKALKVFLTTTEKFPDDPDIPYYIGLTYLQLKNNKKAAVFFKKCVEMQPEHINARFQLGAALIKQGSYDEAVKHLEIVRETGPEREDLGYLTGFAYYKLGEYKKALTHFKAGNTTDKTVKNLTLYYSALSETQLSGLTKEARLMLREVITSNPTSPVASMSHRFLDMQEGDERVERAERRFSLSFTGKAGYDDNVILLPDNKDLDSLRQRKQASVFQNAILRASYKLVTKPKQQLSLSYSINQTIYDSVRSLDVQTHTVALGGLQRGRIGSASWEIRPGLSLDYFLVDYSWFTSRYSFRAPVLLNENARNTSIFEYNIHLRDFKRSPNGFLRNEDRDTVNQEFGFTHYFHTTDWKHYIKMGYTRERGEAEGDNWDYWKNRLSAGMKVSLPMNTKFRGDYIWSNDHYRNTNTLFSINRNDIDRLLHGSLSKDITKNTNIFFGFTRQRHSSRIHIYEYKKNVYSFGITFKF